MNKLSKLYTIIILSVIFFFYACNKEANTNPSQEEIPKEVESVDKVTIRLDNDANTVILNWKNPDDKNIDKIELTYERSDGESLKTVVLRDANADQNDRHTITLEHPHQYIFSLTAINKAGYRSTRVSVSLENSLVSPWVSRADTLIRALVRLYLDNKPRDIWSSNYPQSEGYWDGAAVIWGHGGAFSGYTAFKEATWSLPEYRQRIENLYDNRLLVAIDKFRNTRAGGPEAYAVYPGDGDERFYDDNIWVGIDMAKIYLLTKDHKYLDRAKLVWNFTLSGSDDVMGGGIYWKEGLNSKHTCSTFPGAVLALKLYEATQDQSYLIKAKEWYTWGKHILQDPSDKLFWDNVRLSDENNPDSDIIVSREKYSYNTGQPMQVAALLYKMTGEQQYLIDAQEMAKAAYGRWFVPFRSYLLNQSFHILEPGHVWFQAIMLRGFVELYHIDKNRLYVDAYEKTLLHAWLSPARNRNTNLINNNFWGTTTQQSWEILHEGAVLEMVSQLAILDQE